MATTHPTAEVNHAAQLASDVSVGPYAIIGAQVKLRAGVTVHAHAHVTGDTDIGEGSVVYPFASLGMPGQIYKSADAPGRLVVGPRCEFREHVTVNCGSAREKNLTQIGADCLFMVGAHVAHDCTVGNKVIFANNATLGGHVRVGDNVFIGGLSAVHQFCIIGSNSVIGGMTGVRGHVIPYGRAIGDCAALEGLNLVALQRCGLSHADVRVMQRAFQLLFRGKGVFSARVAQAQRDFAGHDKVGEILDFIATHNRRRPLMMAD